MAWGASAALAALAGVLGQVRRSPPARSVAGITGLAFRALPAVILGGLDSVQGALVGGLLIGVAEVFSGEYLATATNQLGNGYSLIVPYIVMLHRPARPTVRPVRHPRDQEGVA